MVDNTADNPPLKPQRPRNPHLSRLQEAFPDIQENVISAVLIASGNKLEPAFDALLGMGDPDFRPELPSRPRLPVYELDNQKSQIDADEQLARQLASDTSEYGPSSLLGSGSHIISPDSRKSSERTHTGQLRQEKEHSFIDDDLPIIKENIMQGFNDTKTKVNSWVKTLRQRIDGDAANSEPYSTYSPPQARSSYHSNRRTSQGGYDADPCVIDDDFSHLELRDNSHSVDVMGTDDNLAHIHGSKAREVEKPSSNSGSKQGDKKGPSKPKWEPIRTQDSKKDKDPFDLGDSDEDIQPETTFHSEIGTATARTDQAVPGPPKSYR